MKMRKRFLIKPKILPPLAPVAEPCRHMAGTFMNPIYVHCSCTGLFVPSDFVSPSLEALTEILLSTQPHACKIRGHVNPWETPPSLPGGWNQPSGSMVLGALSLSPKETRLKGDFFPCWGDFPTR